jgi:hypothetical protein
MRRKFTGIPGDVKNRPLPSARGFRASRDPSP